MSCEFRENIFIRPLIVTLYMLVSDGVSNVQSLVNRYWNSSGILVVSHHTTATHLVVSGVDVGALIGFYVVTSL